MIALSLDQSMSKSALIEWEDWKPVKRHIIRAGREGVKKTFPHIPYFPTEDEQMDFITNEIVDIACNINPQAIVMEGLSFGSMGNATRDLAGLYYVIRNALFQELGDWSMFTSVAPTTLKSLARKFLPVEEQTVPKPNGKKGTNLLKMEKRDIVRAVPEEHKFLLDGLRMSGKNAGLDDMADAYFLGRYLHNLKKGVI